MYNIELIANKLDTRIDQQTGRTFNGKPQIFPIIDAFYIARCSLIIIYFTIIIEIFRNCLFCAGKSRKVSRKVEKCIKNSSENIVFSWKCFIQVLNALKVVVEIWKFGVSAGTWFILCR